MIQQGKIKVPKRNY